MLGQQGVVRLSPDEDVLEGLGIVEGIEDSLAILLSGWGPVWAATSAAAIECLPVLPGIEALTIFRDRDDVGKRAAEVEWPAVTFYKPVSRKLFVRYEIRAVIWRPRFVRYVYAAADVCAPLVSGSAA